MPPPVGTLLKVDVVRLPGVTGIVPKAKDGDEVILNPVAPHVEGYAAQLRVKLNLFLPPLCEQAGLPKPKLQIRGAVTVTLIADEVTGDALVAVTCGCSGIGVLPL